MSFAEKIGIAEFREVFSLTQNKIVNRLIVSLPGAGCKYYKEHGGCTMCGFHQATKKYSFGLLYPSIFFKFIFEKALKLVPLYNISEVYIFNGGSFLNDKEIPLEFQSYIFKRLGKIKEIKVLFIESRVEYISETKLKMIYDLNPTLELIIAIGFESQDDYIRNKIIRKGLSKIKFERTIALISKFGFKSASYVFLKPLGLSEKEAYEEVQKTINYLLSLKVSELILSSAFVQKDTLVYQEYLKGNFRPPYLWTVILLIEDIIKNNWPLSIGGFSDDPPPVAIIKNCDICSLKIYQIIDKFRQERILEQVPDCSCVDDFKELFC